MERLFRLLGLQYRREDFRAIHRGLGSVNAKVRSGSRELLENLLDTPLRESVLALVDDAPAELRLDRATAYYHAPALDYESVLVTLLEQPGETLPSLAAHHVGELGLTTLRGRLEAIDLKGTGFFVSRVIERALRLLAEPGAGVAHAR